MKWRTSVAFQLVAAAAVLPVGCGGSGSEPGGSTASVSPTRLAAETRGKVTIVDKSCVKVGDVVLVWGPEYKQLSISGDSVEAVNETNGHHLLWHDGDQVLVGGGLVPYESFDAAMKKRIGNCVNVPAESLWLVSY